MNGLETTRVAKEMTRQALKSDFETAVLVESFDGSVAEKTSPLRFSLSKRALPLATGVHPVVIKMALSAVAWFLAVAWFDFFPVVSKLISFWQLSLACSLCSS